jgi:hypothetical protein
MVVRFGPLFDDPWQAAQAAVRRQGLALVWYICVRRLAR